MTISSEGLPRSITVRPLADLANQAKKLGFQMRAADEKPRTKNARGIITVQLVPIEDHVRRRVIEAAMQVTGSSENDSITCQLMYRPGDDKVGVFREAAGNVLTTARDVMAG